MKKTRVAQQKKKKQTTERHQKGADDVERDEVEVGEERIAALLAGVVGLVIAHRLRLGTVHHDQLPRLTRRRPIPHTASRQQPTNTGAGATQLAGARAPPPPKKKKKF